MTGRLAECDPVAAAVPYLAGHPDVLAALGGDATRVGGRNAPPYPRVMLSDPPGDDRSLTWLLEPSLQIMVVGDPDGSTPKPTLRQLLYVVLDALAAWPTVPSPAGAPVVTAVGSRGAGGWAPLPNGQARYLATLGVSMHPPTPPL